LTREYQTDNLHIGETSWESLENAGDSKSPAERLVGSSPTSGTTKMIIRSGFLIINGQEIGCHFSSPDLQKN